MDRSAAAGRISLFAPSAWPAATRESLRILGPAAEERGFCEIWVPEHVATFASRASRIPHGETGTFDPVVLLTFLAAHTSRIRLGTGVALVSQRQPLFFAKEIASLDQLSGGRVDVGAGVGWIREEFEALGLRREDRGPAANRNLSIMVAAWTGATAGQEAAAALGIPACESYPRPVQAPHPPLYVGGHSDAGLLRAARFGQGWLPFNLDVETFAERRAVLAALLRETGRQIDDLRVAVCPFQHPAGYDEVVRYLDAGADQVILSAAEVRGSDLIARLDALAEQVVAKVDG